MYPAIKPHRKTGDEAILSPCGNKVSDLQSFWQWAYSDLIGNAERGTLAEYLVACALGISDAERVSWDRYDLLSKKGVRIEIKATGYLQTWEQKDLSKPIFGIRPTYGWDSQTNTYDTEQRRQSDIYVFCVHKHTEQATVDPLQLSQWDFYLMPTSTLNEKLGLQRTATLSALVRAGAELCEYDHLCDRIHALIL